ncbi:MAG: hypothetical protein ACOYH4_02695 [Saccharofermentanales bacterium]|jgi:NADH:ubiquinone oxidoreductase subunit 6 (subunit J)
MLNFFRYVMDVIPYDPDPAPLPTPPGATGSSTVGILAWPFIVLGVVVLAAVIAIIVIAAKRKTPAA